MRGRKRQNIPIPMSCVHTRDVIPSMPIAAPIAARTPRTSKNGL